MQFIDLKNTLLKLETPEENNKDHIGSKNFGRFVPMKYKIMLMSE